MLEVSAVIQAGNFMELKESSKKWHPCNLETEQPTAKEGSNLSIHV